MGLTPNVRVALDLSYFPALVTLPMCEGSCTSMFWVKAPCGLSGWVSIEPETLALLSVSAFYPGLPGPLSVALYPFKLKVMGTGTADLHFVLLRPVSKSVLSRGLPAAPGALAQTAFPSSRAHGPGSQPRKPSALGAGGSIPTSPNPG